MPIVAIADGFPQSVFDAFEHAGWTALDGTSWNESELFDHLPRIDAILVRSRTKMTADRIEAASRLRIIGRGGVGLDSIDLEAAKSRGIQVVNTPGASAIAVAELVILFLLALARRLPEADRTMKEELWEKKNLTGGEVFGKTLGILGFGSIGRLVAERALALGMDVIWHDAYPVKPGKGLENQCRKVEFGKLLESCDMLTVHVPLLAGTRGLIGAGELQRMKVGSYLVDCARGGIVDEAAVARALESGHLAGAAFDVFAEEPLGESALRRAPGVIMTPHIGASTRESQERVGTDIVRKIIENWQPASGRE